MSYLNPEIDKEYHYGNYTESVDKNNELNRSVVRKAMDMAEGPETNVQADKTTTIRNGFGWKEMAVLGALGVGGAYMLNQSKTPEPPPVPPVVASEPNPDVERKFDVLHFDQQGKLIDVQQLPDNKKAPE